MEGPAKKKKSMGVGSSKFSDSVGLEQILRLCISNEVPGVADAYLENTEVGPTRFLVISRTGHMRATTKFHRPHLHLGQWGRWSSLCPVFPQSPATGHKNP